MKTTLSMLVILGAGLAHAPAYAQATADTPQAAAATPLADTRFNSWLGCWRLEDDLAGTGARMCITPEAQGVRLQTIVGTQRGLEELVIADGTARPIADSECKGTAASEWSQDGLRVFRTTIVTCVNESPRTIKAIAFLAPNAVWTHVQHVSATGLGTATVRVQRYRRAINQKLADGTPSPQPRGSAGAMPTARDAALNIDDVIELSGKLPEEAVQAALADTRHGFNMTSTNLVKLDDAGVPGSVIDLMIALTFPKRFQVDHPGSSSAPMGVSTGMGWYDPFMNPVLDSQYADCYIGNRYYGYRSYYNMCGYYPTYGYGYNGYYNGYYYPGGGWVIVDNGGGTGGGPVETGTGRAINGRGYTQIRERGSDGVASRGTSRGDGSSSGYSGGGGGVSSGGYSSGSSGSSSSGGSSGGDSGRTAVARPPGGGN